MGMGEDPDSDRTQSHMQTQIPSVTEERPWLAPLWRWLANHPLRAIGIYCVLVLIALALCSRLWLDRSTKAWWLQDDPEVKQLDELKGRFGGDEILVIAFQAQDLFSPRVLKRIKQLTNRLQAIPHVAQVKSLSNAIYVGNRGDELWTEKLFDKIPPDQETINEYRRMAMDNPLLQRNIIATDGVTTSIFLFFEANATQNQVYQSTGQIIELLGPYEQELEIHIAGTAYLKWYLSKQGFLSFALLFPLLMFIAGVIFFVLSRSLRLSVLPMATNLGVLLLLLGLAGGFKHGINGWSIASLIFLIVLSTAYTTHALMVYIRQIEPGTHSAAGGTRLLLTAYQRLSRPLLLVCLTTFLGFITLATNPIPGIRHYGLLLGSGMVCIYLTNILLTLPLCHLTTRRVSLRIRRFQTPQWVVGAASWVAGRGVRYMVLVVLVLVGAATLGVVTTLRPVSNSLEWLSESSPVRVSERFIGDHLYPTAALNVFVEREKPDTALDPEFLMRLEKMQTEMAALEKTEGILSIVDYLRQLHKSFRHGDPSCYRVPSTADHPNLARQLLLFFDDPHTVGRWLDEQRQGVRFYLRTSERDSVDFLAWRDSVRRIAERQLSDTDAKVAVTSTLAVICRSFDTVVVSMFIATSLSILMISLVVLIRLQNLMLMIWFMIPNTIPILLTFGVVALVGTPLDYALSTLTCGLLGIAVDDTIHFFEEYKRLHQQGLRGSELIHETIVSKGWAMVLSTAILICGLAFFNFGTVGWIRYLGSFTCAGIFFCLLADLFVLPAILNRFYKGPRTPAPSPGEQS